MAKKKPEKILTLEERYDLMAKKFSGSIVQSLSKPTIKAVEVLSTGCLGIDRIIGGGGWYRTGFNQVWGRPSIGKTTLLTSTAADASLKGMTTAYIDVEQKQDTDYFRECVIASGGNPEHITQVKPDSGAACLEIVLKLVGWVDLIIIDSITAVVSTAVMDTDDIEQTFWANQAKLLTQFVNAIRPKLGTCGPFNEQRPVPTAIVGISQARANMRTTGKGDGLYAPGPWAWKHAMAIDIKLLGEKKKFGFEGELIGIEAKAQVKKNVIGKPTLETGFDLLYGKGIDRALDALRTGKDMGLVVTKGAWYKFADGTAIGNGLDRAAEALRAEPETLAKLRQDIAERIRNEALVSSEEAPQEV